MAPFDDQQKADVIELIHQDTRAAEAQFAAMAEIQKASVEATRVQKDLRITTEQAVRATELATVKQQEDTTERSARSWATSSPMHA